MEARLIIGAILQIWWDWDPDATTCTDRRDFIRMNVALSNHDLPVMTERKIREVYREICGRALPERAWKKIAQLQKPVSKLQPNYVFTAPVKLGSEKQQPKLQAVSL